MRYEQAKYFFAFSILFLFVFSGCDKNDIDDIEVLDLSKNQVDILFISESVGIQQIFTVQDTALDRIWNASLSYGEWGVLDPAWSNDPRKFAFSDIQWIRSDLYPFVSNIYIRNMDSTNSVSAALTPITYDTLRRDTNGISYESINLRPDWSLNGQHMIYISNRTGRFEIYMTSISDSLTGDSIPRKLSDTTDKIDIYCFPAFSPDGTKILYTSSASGYEEIWQMDTSGTNKSQRTHTNARITRRPRYSPTMDKIAFHSNFYINGTDSLHIFTMDLDGSNIDTITTTGNCYDPYWSPDGQKIIFARKYSYSKGYINIIDRNGDNPYRLISGDSKSYYPVWRPSRIH
jgi:Tol biopolymer transport system component